MAAQMTMEPLSVRIPGDLYLWLAQIQIEGATTNSDKMRVLLGDMKRQHDGAYDYSAANAFARDVTKRARDALVRLEGETGQHSEVLGAVLDFLVATLSTVISSAPQTIEEAARLENLLVRRSFALAEALLRQGVSSKAAAYDTGVIRKNSDATLELATHMKLT